MKQTNFLFIPSIILLGLATSCGLNDDSDDLLGNWIRRSDFEGVPRSNAVVFTIEEFAYVGLGFDGDDDLNDFWRYDSNLDFWTRVDAFPGIPRRAAVAFAVNGKGYAGTGFSSDQDIELRDFWEFDPLAPSGSQWQQIADFPGSARYNAVAFAVDNFGYVGSGFDDNWLKDFYEYDPSTNTWEQIVSLGGSKRENATAFVIDNKAYVGTGTNNGSYVFDFWEFNSTDNTWDRKLELDEEDDYNIIRSGGVGLGLDGLGYIIAGNNGNNLTSVWEYLPSNDSWEERTALEGIARINAVGFSINGRSFLTTGSSGTLRLDDLWEFKPTEEFDEND